MSSSTVLCIDRSGSMGIPTGGSNTPLGIAQADAKFYTWIQFATDQLGMVSFASTAATGFGLTGMSVANKLQATRAISGLTAYGSTDIQDALNDAEGMVASSGTPKAVILMTDGMANEGQVPPVAPTGSTAPIFAIGLGPYAKGSALQAIVNEGPTGGAYYASPSNHQLQQIYNDIIGQSDVAATLTNQLEKVAGGSPVHAATDVGSGAPSVKIGATWTNGALSYNDGAPGPNEINLSIQGPTGFAPPTKPTTVGDGYVMYEIASPIAGTYSSTVSMGGATGSSYVTVGAFDPSLSVKLNVSTPKSVRLGQSVDVACRAVDTDGSAVSKWTLSGFVDSPAVDPKDVAVTHKAELAALSLPQAGEPVTDNQRMLALEALRGPDKPLLPRQKFPLTITQGQGENRFSFTPQTRGVHIVNIKGAGFARATGRDFSLVRVVPIVVE